MVMYWAIVLNSKRMVNYYKKKKKIKFNVNGKPFFLNITAVFSPQNFTIQCHTNILKTKKTYKLKTKDN